MAKQPTKTDRWTGAVRVAREAAEKAQEIQDQLLETKQAVVDALEELKSMAEELGEPYDNMPEGLQQSPFGQRCEAMQQLDLDASADDDLDDLIAKIDEAEGTDVPLGFGRD